jgi:hypothetical protein
VLHPKYAQTPVEHIRSFLLLMKDLKDLFDYIEPADSNLDCFSYRTHALLLRACIEFEANSKSILAENGYVKAGDLNMKDYQKIDVSHHLSSYQVKVPYWHGTRNIRSPFSAWTGSGSLAWYEAYLSTKYDRHAVYHKATFDHLIDACCAVLVILSAQFITNDFVPGSSHFAWGSPVDGMVIGIGDFFRVKFPDDWPMELRYDFTWQEQEQEQDPFQNFDYSKID